jgi:hypothetical protein
MSRPASMPEAIHFHTEPTLAALCNLLLHVQQKVAQGAVPVAGTG